VWHLKGRGACSRRTIQSLTLEPEVVINILQLAITSSIIPTEYIFAMIKVGPSVISAELPAASIARECECLCQDCVDSRHCRRLDCYIEEFHPYQD
jgi:hypothetical protein